MNTRSKRASSVGILLPFILAPVLADGTIGVGDRQHIAFSYSGIAPAAIAEGAGSSAGVATVTGVGASTAAAAGLSPGSATVSGVGRSTHAGAGTAAGVATVSGVMVDANNLPVVIISRLTLPGSYTPTVPLTGSVQ